MQRQREQEAREREEEEDRLFEEGLAEFHQQLQLQAEAAPEPEPEPKLLWDESPASTAGPTLNLDEELAAAELERQVSLHDELDSVRSEVAELRSSLGLDGE
jgi:hypothetical protein